MIIEVENLGKRFRREWVFRNFSFTFSENKSYAIVGPNGSGKSTLLQVLAGYIPASEGKISYFSLNGGRKMLHNNKDLLAVEPDDLYQNIVLAAPYLELVEEFTLLELLVFHFSFKKIRSALTINDLVEIMYLEGHENKYVRDFSSGMKQRLKLGLAFYSEAELLFLDEPTANLDKKGLDWYLKEIDKIIHSRLIFVASNQEQEYTFCTEKINLQEFKNI